MFLINKPARAEGEVMGMKSIELKRAEARIKELESVLKRLITLEGCPDENPSGDEEFGLHCGVEDIGCNDRYEGANYGYSCGVERVQEWIKNEIMDCMGEGE